MSAADLLSVEAALAGVLSGVTALNTEIIPLLYSDRRYLAADLQALRMQPPYDCSSMDGYAVRCDGLAAGARLRVIGESAAGKPFEGTVGAEEAVRIFTGAVLPAGADAVVMQEDTRPGLGRLELRVKPLPGRHIRRRGLDFMAGDVGLTRGMRMNPVRLALAAAYGHDRIPVVRKPKVAIIATGDELALPGSGTAPDRIIASNLYAIATLTERNGADVIGFNIEPDRVEAIAARIEAAKADDADVIVTLGGASVGQYDLVRDALQASRFALGFWRIAMRPGKPLIHGRIGSTVVLGLPGNPVSAIVCALLFLQPLLRGLQGDPEAGADRLTDAICIDPLPANDFRQDYLRAERVGVVDGLPLFKPLPTQDSAMLAALAHSNGLLVRAPNAPALPANATCRVLLLDE